MVQRKTFPMPSFSGTLPTGCRGRKLPYAPFQGTVLAPGDAVYAKVNVDGSIIADYFDNISGGETHRWDFQVRGSGGTPAAVEAVNQYEAAGKLLLQGSKALTGRAIRQGDNFTFTVKDGGNVVSTGANNGTGTITFTEIGYTLADVARSPITLKVKEEASTVTGVTADPNEYEVTVTLADAGNGSVTVTAQYPNNVAGLKFTNTYAAAGSWKPEVTKELAGRSLNAGEFEFTLSENGQVKQTKTNGADGKVTFDEIGYTLADAGEHVYEIRETAGTLPGMTYDGRTLGYKVKVEDNGDGTLKVTEVEKPQSEVFKNSFGVDVTFSKAAAGQGGELPGAALTVRKADGTFEEMWTSQATVKVLRLTAGEYTMHEDLAPLGYQIASDIVFRVNGDGSVEIREADGWKPAAEAKVRMIDKLMPSVMIRARKTLHGRTLKDQEFSFVLKDAGGKVLQTKSNDAGGDVAFTVRLTAAGTYRYTVNEVIGTEKGMTYDHTIYTAEITVTARNGITDVDVAYLKDGKPMGQEPTFLFTNTYKPEKPKPDYAAVSVPLSAHKALTGGKLKAGQFAFELLDGAGKLIETVSNDAEGNVAFTPRRFSKAGTFTYTVREKAGQENRITYDTTVYRAIITTTPNGSGLTASVRYEKDGIPYDGTMKFVNRIEAPKTGDRALAMPLTLALAGLTLLGAAYYAKKRRFS